MGRNMPLGPLEPRTLDIGHRPFHVDLAKAINSDIQAASLRTEDPTDQVAVMSVVLAQCAVYGLTVTGKAVTQELVSAMTTAAFNAMVDVVRREAASGN